MQVLQAFQPGETKNSKIMKAIIYAGIGLFSVATVYGLADYYSSQKKGTLSKLYAEDEVSTPAAIEEKTTTVLPVKNVEMETEKIKTVNVKTKSIKKAKESKRKISMKNFSRARIPEDVLVEKIKEEPVKEAEVIIPEKITVVPAEKVVVKEDDSERKISLDMYSRAPLKKRVTPVKKN